MRRIGLKKLFQIRIGLSRENFGKSSSFAFWLVNGGSNKKTDAWARRTGLKNPFQIKTGLNPENFAKKKHPFFATWLAQKKTGGTAYWEKNRDTVDVSPPVFVNRHGPIKLQKLTC